jgi:hypothetical protein
MNNIKTLLREEIYLNNKKNLLSEHSLLMIQNQLYVNNTLGIQINLNEHNTLNIRKQIVEQQLIIENLITSINNYLGDIVKKGKETTMNLINSVKNLKDLAVFFKNILLDPTMMSEALDKVKKTLNIELANFENLLKKLINKIKPKVIGLSDKLNVFLKNVITYGKNLQSKNGWVGFLSMLGLSVLLIYIKTRGSTIFLENMVESLTNIETVIKMFNSLQDLIKTALSSLNIDEIFGWFTNIVTMSSGIGIAFTISDIINITSEILNPTVKLMTKKFNLEKK